MATTTQTVRTVAHGLEAGAERWPDRTAVEFGVGAYTYRDLWSRGRMAAQAFADQGVKRGEPVLVMLDNTIEFVDAWLGLALIGAIQVPVNTAYIGEILRHQVKDSGAWLMLVDEAYAPRIEALGEDCGELSCVLIATAGWANAFADAKELPV